MKRVEVAMERLCSEELKRGRPSGITEEVKGHLNSTEKFMQ
jgi:hypothetical protein